MLSRASVGNSVLEKPLDLAPAEVAVASSFYTRYGKRASDLALGSLLLVLAAPLILVLALLVIATSGFPPFYAATRLGKNGRPFRMWKLRTMVKDADSVLQRWKDTNPGLAFEYEQNLKLRDDPRVTPLGRILRRLSLDELPQFLNVVRGEMSLVGPRPYYVSEVAGRPDVIAALVRVRPGITGPWQVGGRNDIGPEQRMTMDQAYVGSISAAGDIACLARTARCLLRANGL